MISKQTKVQVDTSYDSDVLNSGVSWRVSIRIKDNGGEPFGPLRNMFDNHNSVCACGRGPTLKMANMKALSKLVALRDEIDEAIKVAEIAIDKSTEMVVEGLND